MAQLRIERFHGGMTDLYVGAEPHFAQYCKNLLIDRNAKPYQRPGRALFPVGTAGDVYQIPGGDEPILRLFAPFSITPISVASSYLQYYLFAHKGTKVYFCRAQVDPSTGKMAFIPSGVGATEAAWTELPVEAGTSISFKSQEPVDFFVRNTDHIYIANGFGSGGNFYKTFIRTQTDGFIADTIRVGLPTPAMSVSNTPVVGTKSYIFQAFYERTYTTYTGETYIDRSAVTELLVEDVATIDLFAQIVLSFNLTAILPFYSTANNYGVSSGSVDIRLRVFRSPQNSAETFEIYLYGATANKFSVDSDGRALVTSDETKYKFDIAAGNDALLVGEAAPYIAGGEVDSDQPNSNFRYVTYTDDNVAFYSRGDERVYHSKQSAPDASPVTFFKEVSSNVTGLSSVRNYAIAFERFALTRLEGTVDDLGRGTILNRVISDEVGCIWFRGIIEVDKEVYFAAKDGIYRTDGFSAQKISSHLNDRYKALVTTRAQERSIEASYDQVGRRITFSFNDVADQINAEDTTPAKMVSWIIDLNFPMENEQACITEYVHPIEDGTNNFGSRVTSTTYVNGEKFDGDNYGFTYKSDDDLLTDVVRDPNLAETLWPTRAVTWTWQSAAMHFGSESVRKWVTKCSLFCKKLTNTLNMQLASINDDKQQDPRRMRSVSISETDLGNPGGFFIFKRWFPARTLRCMYKQLRISNDDALDFAASAAPDDIGEVTAVGGQPDRKNVQRKVATFGTSWPVLDLVGQQIYFEFDNYQEGFLITNYSTGSDTVRVKDEENQIPLGDFLWIIRGQSKVDKFRLEAINIDYVQLGESIDARTGVV